MKTPYRYSLELHDGTWYGYNNNVVITTPADEPFYFYGYIANWRDIRVTDTRNMRMGGFVRSRTNELQFYKALATIARHAKYTKGINKEVKLYIDRFDDLTQSYKFDSASVINFAQSRDEEHQFAVFLNEAGAAELIKTREETKYNIPVTGPEVVNVRVLPQLVRGVSVFTSVTPDDDGPSFPNRSTSQYNMIGYARLKEEIYEILDSPNFRPVDYFDVLATNLAMAGGASTSMEMGQPYQERAFANFSPGGIVKIVNGTSKVVDYLLRANVTLSKVKVKGKINVYIKNDHSTSPVNFKINFYNTNIGAATNSAVGAGSVNTVTVPAASAGTYEFTMDEQTFSMPADSVLYVVLEHLTPSIVEVEYTTQGGMPLMVEYQHRTTEYVTPGYNAFTLASKLVDKITNGAITFNSDLLTNAIDYKTGIDCRPDKLQITSTQCLQGYTDPVIYISLKELFTSLSIWLGCGMTVLREALTLNYTETRIEDWDFFYKEELPGNIPNVIADFMRATGKPVIEDAQEMLYSEVRYGYTPTDVDVNNIEDDVHTTLVFTTQYTKVSNVLEMISPIHASPFALYQEHFKGYSTKNLSTNASNNNFVIQYKDGSVGGIHTALYPRDIDLGMVISGVTDPARLLNPGLTPKKCMYRNSGMIYSHMPYTDELPTDNYRLTYQSTERNPKLVSRIGTDYTIVEAASEDMDVVVVLAGKKRYFYPKYLKWTAPSIENYKHLWELNRFGTFRVYLSYLPGGHPFLNIFPVESSDMTATNDTYEFKGLLTASNNLSVLIR